MFDFGPALASGFGLASIFGVGQWRVIVGPGVVGGVFVFLLFLLLIGEVDFRVATTLH